MKKLDRIRVENLLMIRRGGKERFILPTVSAVCTARSLASQYADRGAFTIKSESIDGKDGQNAGYLVEIYREEKKSLTKLKK